MLPLAMGPYRPQQWCRSSVRRATVGLRVSLPLAFAAASPSVPAQRGTSAATALPTTALTPTVAAAITTTAVTTTAVTAAALPTWLGAHSTAVKPTTATVALAAATFASTAVTLAAATVALTTSCAAGSSHGSAAVHRL